MFIITNRTDINECKPLKTDTFKEAQALIIEHTFIKLYAAYKSEVDQFLNLNKYQEKDLKSIEFMQNLCSYLLTKHNITCSICDDSSLIVYDDCSYNAMQIYDIDKL